MASEIRVNTINNRSGLGTVSITDTGLVVSGIITATTVNTSSTSTFSSGLNVTGGSVGIGTDNPTEKLDINGAVKVYANTNIATFKNNQLRSDAAGTYYFDHGTTGQSFTFRTSTSSSLDTTGPSVTSAGNISFPSGQGIDFSATSDAGGMTSELLDDYEEGTWTPSLTFNGVTTGITYTTQEGYYTKIGNIVNIQWHIILSNKGSATGNAVLSGNPFSAFISGGANNAGTVAIEGNGSSWTAGTYSLAWSDGGIYIRYNGSVNWSPVTNTNFTNTTDFYGSNTYRVS